MLDTVVSRVRKAAVLFVESLYAAVGLLKIIAHFSAFVGGTVVYEKYFKVLVCLRGYRFNTPLKIFFDIVYRNDNAYHTPSSLSIFRVLSRPVFISNLALNPIAFILAESRRAFVALE